MDATSIFGAVMVILFLIKTFVRHKSSNHCWSIFQPQYLKQQGLGHGFIGQEFKTINLKGLSCSMGKVNLMSI